MQNYTTIIDVLEMRENSFSYRDCRARYDIIPVRNRIYKIQLWCYKKSVQYLDFFD